MHEQCLALLRRQGGAGRVADAGQRHHAAKTRGTEVVRRTHRVGRAVEARPPAIPEAEDGVAARAAPARTWVLCAPDRSRGEVFVDRRVELHAKGCQPVALSTKQGVEPAQRGAWVARYVAGRIVTYGAVELALNCRQAQQDVRTGQIRLTRGAVQFVQRCVVLVAF